MFKYNGAGPVVHVPFDRAYDVRWRPAELRVYPNRGPSPKRGGEVEAAAVVVKPTVPVVQAYRPPGKKRKWIDSFIDGCGLKSFA